MEKVITINNWWDGPLLGLANYNGLVCIYEKIFDETIDEYIDEYYLTPIDDYEKDEIMLEWKKWCNAFLSGNSDSFYQEYLNNDSISKALINSNSKRKYRKKARFHGQFDNGFIPVDYHVEWYI